MILIKYSPEDYYPEEVRVFAERLKKELPKAHFVFVSKGFEESSISIQELWKMKEGLERAFDEYYDRLQRDN